MSKVVDLRSDTVTKPTDEMYDAIRNAPLGDDVFGDDPTVIRLEEMAAKMLGKEKALFIPSGTMGNQIAIREYTNPGDEVIVQDNHHIFKYEGGGLAAISQVQTRTLSSNKGLYDLAELKAAIRPEDIHFPVTKVICIENTHNMEGGMVVPLDHMKDIKRVADEHDIKVHLDGARVFNAAVHLGVDVKEITQYADSVMCCLSKGLASPVGSILAGDADYIKRARKTRRMLGGGMRQSGILAACGIVSLEKMTKRLGDDHANAKIIAKTIEDIDSRLINSEDVHSNIIIFDVSKIGRTSAEVNEKLSENGIISPAIDEDKIRMITIYEHDDSDIEYVCDILKKVLG